MDLYVPRSAKPVPVVVWIFGGSWRFGSKGFHVNVRDLTRHGIAVASIQYRLSDKAVYPAQLDDCRTAVQWLRDNSSRYGLDPQRIGVSGESAGGHLAALLGTTEGSPKIRAVFAMYPPTDLVELSGESKSSDEPSDIEKLLGGPIQQKLALAAEASPVTHVSATSPPFAVRTTGRARRTRPNAPERTGRRRTSNRRFRRGGVTDGSARVDLFAVNADGPDLASPPSIAPTSP